VALVRLLVRMVIDHDCGLVRKRSFGLILFVDACEYKVVISGL